MCVTRSFEHKLMLLRAQHEKVDDERYKLNGFQNSGQYRAHSVRLTPKSLGNT